MEDFEEKLKLVESEQIEMVKLLAEMSKKIAFLEGLVEGLLKNG